MFTFSLLVPIAQDKDLELSYCVPSVCIIGSSRIVVIFQDMTKSGNIGDPIGKAIELFEHTLDKKALVWFQEHKDKFVDLTMLKTMFL